MARVLFVEPFNGGSHRAFLDGLVNNSRHEVVVLGLPEGEWRRRMRLGAQELAPLARMLPGRFDLLIASDMLDLPAFLALTRPRFERTPVMLYFHENQLTYPRIRGTKLNSWFGAMNYLSAAAANHVAFNSKFHRHDFVAALRSLAAHPNNWLIGGTIDAIEAKSSVLPVGVDLEWIDAIPPATNGDGDPLVLWNHRWEFDKAPDVFARALVRLAAEGVPFRAALAGDPGPNPHPALAELPGLLGGRVVHVGYCESRQDYGQLLRRSRVVVSTTRHEFFGVGTVEALYAGCFPVAPAGFNYPALIPEALHARCLWHTEDELAALLRAAFLGPPPGTAALRASAARFSWRCIARQWDEALEELAARAPAIPGSEGVATMDPCP